MYFFIDTAKIEDIKKANEMGIISGVTTNPSLIAAAGGDFHETVKEIASVIEGPISAEVLADDTEGMVQQGLKAVSILKEMGIRTNVTLIFSATQALIAARAGAFFVSPFVGRIEDVGGDGIALIDNISTIFKLHHIETKIIAASIRKTQHIRQCALAGADVVTVPFKVLMESINHPLTTAGIAKFKSDWKKTQHE